MKSLALSLITSQTTVDEALRILAAAEDVQKAETPDTGLEDDGNDIGIVKRKLMDLQEEMQSMSSFLEKMLDENGRQGLEPLKASISRYITDYRTACDATTFYSKEWFSRLFFNLDDKIDLAGHLIAVVGRFTPSNMECWQMLVDNDTDMMNFVSSPHMDI